MATRSGVPLGTVNNYLAGGEWKVSTALALARACGVSLEWLATGEGKQATPAEDLSRKPLFSFVDVDLMARALEAVAQMQHTAGITPGSRRTVQALLLIYDDLVEKARDAGASDAT